MFRLPVRDGVDLRLMEVRHAEMIFALVDRNRAHLRRWLSWVDGTRDPGPVRQFLQASLNQFARGEGFQAGIYRDGVLAGFAGMHGMSREDLRLEIGYWLDQAQQGHGLATDTCRTLVRYAFEELGFQRVELRIAVGNEASAAVARRLGATLEGVEAKSKRLRDSFLDMQRWAVLRP